MKTDKEIVDEATEAAINAGCLVIQNHMGVKSGDVAGVVFSGEHTEEIFYIFLNYLYAEQAYAEGEDE